VRGDWQLLPWLGWHVRNAERHRMRNPITALGRWKLFDNLRRSLVAPTLFLPPLVQLDDALLPRLVLGADCHPHHQLPVYVNFARRFLFLRE